MNIIEHLCHIHRLLANENIDFALIGGLAIGVYGVQRFTSDIDLLIDGSTRLQLKKVFLSNGFLIFSETAEVIQFDGPIPVDVLCANRPLSLAMLRDAKVEPLLGAKVIDAEGLIALKIQAYCNDPKRSLKDKADIAALIEKNSPSLNWQRIRSYAELFGEWPTIEELKNIHES
jgi:predicted nucleotidyltransferase